MFVRNLLLWELVKLVSESLFLPWFLMQELEVHRAGNKEGKVDVKWETQEQLEIASTD